MNFDKENINITYNVCGLGCYVHFLGHKAYESPWTGDLIFSLSLSSYLFFLVNPFSKERENMFSQTYSRMTLQWPKAALKN